MSPLHFLADEKPLLGLVSVNVVLKAVAHFIEVAGPNVLIVLQIIAAGATVWHIARKALQDWSKKHEKTRSPDSSGDGI